MQNLLNIVVDELDTQATICDEVGEPGSYEMGLRFQFAANSLRKFRDTLISIANCQAGIASHAAEVALTDTGLCAHVNQVYRAGPGFWCCRDCEKESGEKMVPFQ